ncbi:hypothetical protein GWI33_014401 [Rhynchophorus ferrugineus]|uniref:Uncharacterized protein n=1 Tax=Rhynchophorus ferrugineus TaxID=354439 RepID=A0A834I1H4_RHYFE|nr:hypothetical protein GWI33_014401 [Rhynchophorus ferrugineus]
MPRRHTREDGPWKEEHSEGRWGGERPADGATRPGSSVENRHPQHSLAKRRATRFSARLPHSRVADSQDSSPRSVLIYRAREINCLVRSNIGLSGRKRSRCDGELKSSDV